MNQTRRRWLRPRFSLGAALLLAGMIATFLGGWTSHRRELQSQYQKDLQTAREVRGRLPQVRIVVVKGPPGALNRVIFEVEADRDINRIDDGMNAARLEHEQRMEQFDIEMRSLRMGR